MIIPILFIVGLAYVGLRVGEKIRTEGFRVGNPRALPRVVRPVSYARLVGDSVRSGRRITPWQLNSAIREAYEAGDWGSVTWLTGLLPKKQVGKLKPDAVPEAPTAQAPNALKSPLDGVDDDSWGDFVGRMKTKDPAYRAQRRVGAWEHNVERLQKLGVGLPDTEEAQYDAFSADMKDYYETCQGLVSEFSGDVINIPGQHNPESADGSWPVTASGVLGLLKVAGPDGARSWLTQEPDRARFPFTTQTFCRVNGCF